MRLSKKMAAVGVASVVVAMTAGAGGATAARLITSKDIKNGTITSVDVKDGSLKRADLSPWLQGAIDKSGKPGPAGDRGPAGPAGADGRDGTNGVDGTNGADGADGVNGADGATGQKGADGMTTYYVTNGTRTVPANSTITYVRPCFRPNTYVVGGGVTTNAGTDPGLNSSPVDHDVLVMESGPDTVGGQYHPAMRTLNDGRAVAAGWKVTVRNNDSHAHAVLIWATCSGMSDVPAVAADQWGLQN